MSDLRKAAEAVLERWDSPAWEWMKQGPTAELMATLRAALAAPRPEPTHPGYILGSHWLETAYSRICAGEAEADVLKDCGWERVDDADARRLNDARYRWLREQMWFQYTAQELDAKIDAAMQEDKT